MLDLEYHVFSLLLYAAHTRTIEVTESRKTPAFEMQC